MAGTDGQVKTLPYVEAASAEERASLSRGRSSSAILNMVVRALERRQISGGCIADVGCGRGDLYGFVHSRFARYVGIDVVEYDGFPEEAQFCRLDLDSPHLPLAAESVDVVAAVEVIEHLENPRDFMRKLARLAKPAGWVVVTTPNQLTWLSLLTLVVKHRYQAFQDVHYPTHLTALLEVDLRRAAAQAGLTNVEIEYSESGRMPLTARHFPRSLSRLFPRRFSENVLVIGQKPGQQAI
jgi:2-polyprenyl-3-methyl-5-hydroxy-6-metoxy-1,4-benzoquinol methylase